MTTRVADVNPMDPTVLVEADLIKVHDVSLAQDYSISLAKIFDVMAADASSLEAIADHVEADTWAAATVLALGEVMDDHATFITVVADLKAQLNRVLAGTTLITTPTLGIGSTPANVANVAFTFRVNGVGYAKAAVAAGTATGASTVPTGTFGACAFDIGVDGTVDAVLATDNATGYASAVLAAAGLPAAAAGHVRMGYVTASKSDGNFVFGTTALDAVNTTVAYTNSAVDVSVSTSAPATLTAPKPASGPATLTSPQP